MKIFELKKKKGRENAVYAIALVENPAIEHDFVYLSAGAPESNIMLNEEKRMIYTPVLIPEQRILRQDNNGEPYQIFFSSETIEEAAQDFMTAKVTDEFNKEHTGQKLTGIQVVENWIIDDPKSDKATLLGFDLPKGTWMQGIKINDEDTISKIKDGTYKGISIEGYFEDFEEKLTNINKSVMNKLEEKIDALFVKLSEMVKPAETEKEEVKMASAEVEGGGMIYTAGEFSEGAQIFINEEMTEVAPDGSYTLVRDGGNVVITVVDGSLAAVEESAEMTEEVEEDNSLEKLTDVAAEQAKVSEKLTEENKNLKEQVEELKAELTKVIELTKEHSEKLSKVEVSKEESIALKAVEVSEPSKFQALKSRVNK